MALGELAYAEYRFLFRPIIPLDQKTFPERYYGVTIQGWQEAFFPESLSTRLTVHS